MEKNRQTVRVADEHGTVIGYTYPKRAKGLVRKCRAEFVSDNEIRLCRQCPTYENMEDKEMDKINYITVNPKEWRRNPDGGSQTVCDRFVISNPLAEEIASAAAMTEVLSVGTYSWEAGVSYVTNGFWELLPNTEYHFLFWLNGGENDRCDETCQLQILFTDSNITASVGEFKGGTCYRLNRGYIKPLKKYKGWELYDITFTTTDARYTQFQLVAERAPMALMPAEEPEVYRDLQNVCDPFEEERPQRHNIFFEDGWPTGKWYSTKALANSHSGQKKPGISGSFGKGAFAPFSVFSGGFPDKKGPMESKEDFTEGAEYVRFGDIVDEIKGELGIDRLRDEFTESMEALRASVEELRESMNPSD